MDEEKLRTQRETLVVAGLLVLGSFFILYPFLDSILMAVVVSYLLKFAHDWVNSYLKNDILSSVTVISAVISIISMSLYLFLNNFFTILSEVEEFSGQLSDLVSNLVMFLNLSPSFQQNLQQFIDQMSSEVTNQLIQMFVSAPSLLIDLGIFFVTALFLYRDRAKLSSQIKGLLDEMPRPEEKILRSLIHSVDKIFRGVFMTQIIVAVILGISTAIGLYLIALITSPIPLIPLWAFLVAVAALLPLVAAFMFYVPLGGYYIMIGQPFKGSLIIVFGIIALNVMTEIFLRPYIGSKQMEEHPLVVFLGFLAGPLVLGLKGLIIGPLLLILTKEFVMDYANLVSDEPAGIHNVDMEE
ncbi:AI-2E family transporter [Candidatus Nanohalovita haloferacivicina]|uniref:AI-2E family transporter n=1 Tax=Candidatus Nanohalovita haloferacivicina TaxID=2978046 RepID=UPI00325FAC67|nr:AI-2E family transporter [Candidatus Nanohalobia archaeon BNXNv]